MTTNGTTKEEMKKVIKWLEDYHVLSDYKPEDFPDDIDDLPTIVRNLSQRRRVTTMVNRTITLSFRRRDRDSSKTISKTYQRTDRTCRCEKSRETFLGESTMKPNQKKIKP